MNMKRTHEKTTTITEKIFGQPTPAKASGLSFSIATVLPVILSAVFLIVISVFSLTGQGYEKQNWYIYATFLLPQIAFVIVAWWYLRYRRISIKTAITNEKCRPKYFLIAFLLQVGLLCLSELNAWFLQFLSGLGYTDAGIAIPSVDGFGFVGVVLVIAIFPAVFEEIIFRGVLLDGLKKNFSLPVSIIVCGAFFALYHQNPAQTIYQCCCGMTFALVAIRAGSILPTILAHFCNNLFVVILYKANVSVIPNAVFIPVMIVSAVCLIGTLVYLIFIDKSNGKDETHQSDDAGKKQFFLFSAVGVAICALTWFSVLLTGM